MVIVYTAILGSCDSLKPAPVGATRAICITDIDTRDTNGWEFMRWTEPSWHGPDPRREAWRLRCLPHLVFNTYDTVVWIDASFTLTDLPRLLHDSAGHDLAGLRHHTRASCYDEGAELVRIKQSDRVDVTMQLSGYQAEGFSPSALTISCILVRQNNDRVSAFNECWDTEIRTHPGDNTQLSLDYAAWKAKTPVHALEGSRKNNPYAMHDHVDHKRRRRPYR